MSVKRVLKEQTGSPQVPKETVLQPIAEKDQEIEDLKRKLRKLEAEVERKQEAEDFNHMCPICRCQMSIPIMMCKDKHLACAHCIACQIDSGRVTRKSYTRDGSAFIMTEFSQKYICCVCRDELEFSFPGALISNMIDSSSTSQCPFCSQEYQLHELGIHVISCQAQKKECPFCQATICLHEQKSHMDQCIAVPCNYTNCSFVGNKKDAKDHFQKHRIQENAKNEMSKILSVLYQIGDKISQPEHIHFAPMFAQALKSGTIPFLAAVLLGKTMTGTLEETLQELKLKFDIEVEQAGNQAEDPSYSPSPVVD